MAKKDLNRFECTGHLGADPESRFMSNGDQVTTFSVASSDSWMDKKTGQPTDSTEWTQFTTFGKLAEAVAKHFKKGCGVWVSAQKKSRTWDDKETGEKRYGTDFIVQRVNVMKWPEGSEPQRSSAKPPTNPEEAKAAVAQAAGEFDDDIPFAPIRHEYLF